MDKRCKNYVGVACIDGSCPMARAEEYEEYNVPPRFNCKDCWYYKGCGDCALYGTDHCDEWEAKKDDRA